MAGKWDEKLLGGGRELAGTRPGSGQEMAGKLSSIGSDWEVAEKWMGSGPKVGQKEAGLLQLLKLFVSKLQNFLVAKKNAQVVFGALANQSVGLSSISPFSLFFSLFGPIPTRSSIRSHLCGDTPTNISTSPPKRSTSISKAEIISPHLSRHPIEA